MKIDFIADTNFLIYVHEGNEMIKPFLNFNFGISFISEIELLGFKNLSTIEVKTLKLLLEDCIIFDLNEKIKNKTIELKQKYSIKLPDAIIAATCIITKTPLVTADKGFTKISEIELILLDL